MLVKFFKHGTGNGHAVINYLLGRHRDREHARVLVGDPELTIKLINSLKFASKYTSGCLSFEEQDIPELQKKEIMEMFESALFRGVGKENYNITWIEHLDKGRLELNFVIPKVHLGTGRQLHVYSHKADMPLTRSFRRLVNLEYKLTDPDAQDKRRQVTQPKDMPKSVIALRANIHEKLAVMVSNGSIKNRNEMIKAITGIGLKVVRTAKNSISIANPNPNAKKNIRLTGDFYNVDFSPVLKVDNEQSKINLRREVRGDYIKRCNARRERDSKRYKTQRQDTSYNLTPIDPLKIYVDREPEAKYKGKLSYYESSRKRAFDRIREFAARLRKVSTNSLYAIRNLTSVSRKVAERTTKLLKMFRGYKSRSRPNHRPTRGERLESIRSGINNYPSRVQRQSMERSNKSTSSINMPSM